MPDTLTTDGGRKALRSPAGRTQHFRARNPELRIECRIAGMVGRQRKGVVLDDEVVRLQLHLVVGTEAEVVVLALGRRVDPPALVAAERALLVVVGDDVLTELRPDGFEPVAEVTDDRKVSQDGVLPLRQIVDHDQREQDDHDSGYSDHHTDAILPHRPVVSGMPFAACDGERCSRTAHP